jgi:hypothetical protein
LFYDFLSAEILQLDLPEDEIRRGSECKPKLKTNITTERRLASMKGNWADEPDLAHARNHASNTEAEGSGSGDAWRQSLGIVPEFGGVAGETMLEEEVVGERDTLVNGEPVAY